MFYGGKLIERFEKLADCLHTDTKKSVKENTRYNSPSGDGGFDWGATQAGFSIIWANDIEPHAAFAYKSIFPEVPFIIGDIRTVSEFPEADVLIGCYPCTGFSIAARRRWIDRPERDLMKTPGNFLYLEFIRALKQVKPKFPFKFSPPSSHKVR